MNQVPLPVLHPWVFHHKSHLRSPQRILYPFQLLIPFILPLKSPQSCYLRSHLRIHRRIFHQKNPPQFQILYQKNVTMDTSKVFQNYSHLEFHQRNLPWLQILNQITTLPVEIPQVFYLRYHLTCHCMSLPYLLHMHQGNLLVDISKVFQKPPHLASYWRSKSQLHHLQQVDLPVDIPQIFLSQTQPQFSRNPSKSLKWHFL